MSFSNLDFFFFFFLGDPESSASDDTPDAGGMRGEDGEGVRGASTLVGSGIS